jgi:molybdopterin-containing oxidoreductase family iron-sulfur binding subunit
MDERKSPVKLPVLGNSAGSNPEEGLSRRRFMALFGASAAIATGAGCKATHSRAAVVPYTKKQEEVVPGIADHYASTFQQGEVAYPVLVKAREGRPIYVEGNDEHPRYRGKTSLQAIADVLGLYDPDRLHGPYLDGRPTTWSEAIDRMSQGLKAANGRPVVLMTPALLSPSRRTLIDRLREAVPGLRHLQWEPAADHAGRRAERELYGENRAAQYHFDKAQVIVALEADFLGTLGDTVSATAGFSSMRRPATAASPMSRLYVLEGGMSLTGSKADVRIPVRPSSLARIAFGLLRAVHLKSGRPLPEGLTAAALEPFALDKLPEGKAFASNLESLVTDLATAGGKALVIAGPAASPEAHAACLALNAMLGAEGNTEGGTIDSQQTLPAPALASPDELKQLVDEMAAGKIAGVVFWDVNPGYDYPDQDAFKSALGRVPLRARFGMISDETGSLCSLVLATHHWLESWNDFEVGADTLTLQQPLVAPLYDTLQAEDIVLRVLDKLGHKQTASYEDWLKQRWQSEVQPKGSPIAFSRFWQSSLHDGLYRRQAQPLPARKLDGAACARAAAQAQNHKPGAMELVLDVDPRLYDGRFANNGWLQEMPDPVTKVSWGNPLSISPTDADRLGLKNGDLVSLGRGPALPVLRQRGQAAGVLRLTVGHGREQTSIAAQIGTRAAAFATLPGLQVVPLDGVTATGGKQNVILAQDHDTKDGRDIAREWTLAEFAHKAQHESEAEDLPTLYEAHEHKGARWGMAIDLSSCVGCGACVVACQSENNIPVVGPEQMSKGRSMHWMRIDRYYDGGADSSSVVHEPMLCQHCDNAPCETVCPVNATNHSEDGLNQMAYTRCVGTRYCANNCPYKVRRFNFLDFTRDTPASVQLAFNPEVTVRPRGVMEKCTFCVQRIRNAEQVAKREGRGLRDHDVVTACESACPANAIVFGDLNNPNSDVAKLSRNNRGFRVLEELGTKPAITYLAQLKNPSGRGER